MTEDEIKNEFYKHPANAPIMLAFRSWLIAMQEDAVDGCCKPQVYPHLDHGNMGKLAQARYALNVFDSVMAENEKHRRASDMTPHK